MIGGTCPHVNSDLGAEDTHYTRGYEGPLTEIMHESLSFLAIGLILAAHLTHAVSPKFFEAENRDSVSRSALVSRNTAALSGYLVRRTEGTDSSSRKDEFYSTSHGEQPHLGGPRSETSHSRSHEDASLFASQEVTSSPGSHSGEPQRPDGSETIVERPSPPSHRYFPASSNPRAASPVEDSARSPWMSLRDEELPHASSARSPSPGLRGPSVATTPGQRRILRSRLARASLPLAHTFYQRAPEGPLYRLQKTPRGFREWRERAFEARRPAWRDVSRRVTTMLMGRRRAYFDSHYVQTHSEN